MKGVGWGQARSPEGSKVGGMRLKKSGHQNAWIYREGQLGEELEKFRVGGQGMPSRRAG